MQPVQSAITHISFPQSLADDRDLIYKLEDWIADLDALCKPELNKYGMTWTAPRWMMQGDILFFYCTKSAKTNITKLLREAKRNHSPGSNIKVGWLLLSGVARLLAKKAKQPTERVRRQ